ncbi:MAG: DUF3617 domain-containing protein [Proteobacteria bacterium]|nr:DUF3617 domain-containing protein [Pseudomonadota bacterium]
MIRKILFSLFALFAVSAFAYAGDGPDMKEGLWEITTEVHSPGMELHFPPFTNTQCITKQDIVPQGSQPGQDACKLENHKISGNTVSWTMKCNDAESGYTSGSGEVTYAGNSFKGTFVIKGEGDMEITSKMSGKYLGPCKK